ncbi:hypothetical protein MUU53_03650 [Rhizobium lemnae]|uniref:Uncharacterized protein n=1 Tax=Rhizobium lemnae TaxID=1214924 RepID=A0ABV8EB30_9HYPH|nr:hypothetical protein [Rhizobium lemnae]MCJ8507002.1 hypothetical protein [Rhizobium lemnae]
MPFEIIVVGGPDFISDTARRAWHCAKIKLIGPLRVDELHDAAAARCGGVLLDLGLDADVLYALSERLMRLSTPFLFVVNSPVVRGSAKPFLLNEYENDIRTIVDALALDGADISTRALH